MSSSRAKGGRGPDFYALGPRMMMRRRPVSVSFVAFDVLHVCDVSTIAEPYSDRRRLLELLELSGPCWLTVPSFDQDSRDVLLEACAELHVEGRVAKRTDAPYEPGKRSAAWVKAKTAYWRDQHAPMCHER